MNERDTGHELAHQDPISPHYNDTRATHECASKDPATNFLLKSDLLKTPPDPFDGTPGTFTMWSNILMGRMNCVNLNPIEKLQVMFANTSGRPQELVKDYLSTASPQSAESAVEVVWSTFYERYGSQMAGAQLLIDRVKKLPHIQSIDDEDSISRMLDACRNAVCSMEFSPQLNWLNTHSALQMLSGKLPESLRNRWRTFGVQSKINSGQNPNLQVFVGFLRTIYKESVDDFFKQPTSPGTSRSTTPKLPTPTGNGRDHRTQRAARVFRTEGVPQDTGNDLYCHFHDTNKHCLKDCRSFAKLNRKEKLEVVKSNNLCFRCLGPHFISTCKSKIPNCDICKKSHLTAMHYDDSNLSEQRSTARVTMTNANLSDYVPYCVFSKTLLVEVTHPSSGRVVKCLAILDDQSTRCFADPKFIDLLKVNAPKHLYSVETLNGLSTNVVGNLISGIRVRKVGGSLWYTLPKTLTCDAIPDTRQEMATPELIRSLPHLKHLANKFVYPDRNIETLLLIGADAGELMTFKTLGNKAPYVHETLLGHALVGPVAKDMVKSFTQPDVSKFRTLRTSLKQLEHIPCNANNIFKVADPFVGPCINVFERFCDDEEKGFSANDSLFLDKLRSGVTFDSGNHVVLPLPFREDEPKLPNNREAVYFRTLTTLNKLKKQETKLEQCVDSIAKNLQMGHVEEVPKAESSPEPGKAWWLPVFPVTHPKKDTARLVFDASASYQSVSLNDTLLQGPDMNNDLRAVLLRFRRFPIAFSCDIKHMFQNFGVPKIQRDFLRFYWFRENDPTKPIVQYRSNVHLFGAKSSPSVAEFGLRFIVQQKQERGEISEEAARFITSNFYVDDGLHSCHNISDAVSIIKETRDSFQDYGLTLHKIQSNSREVEASFSAYENGKPT